MCVVARSGAEGATQQHRARWDVCCGDAGGWGAEVIMLHPSWCNGQWGGLPATTISAVARKGSSSSPDVLRCGKLPHEIT
jgi:hypothetical protein